MIIKSKHWNQAKSFFSSKKTALAQQNKETQQRCDEMGQYGRRLYQRIDSVPNQNNEKAEGFFEFVKRSHWRNSRPWYGGRCTRQTHRIGSDFTYKKAQKLHTSLFVRFMTFRHRRAFYRARKSKGIILQSFVLQMSPVKWKLMSKYNSEDFFDCLQNL